jgi:uncharacterized protein YjiS (DUF1127 family)
MPRDLLTQPPTAPPPVPPGAPRLAPHRRAGARILAWWRRNRSQRSERLQAAALASFSPHLLHDMGVSEELALRALARGRSPFERAGASASATLGLMRHLGSW